MATRNKSASHARITVHLTEFEATPRGGTEAAKNHTLRPIATAESIAMSAAKLNVDATKPFKAAFSQSARPPRQPYRKTIPVTLRLTETERTQLEEMAAGMTLSSYIRARLFTNQEKRRQRRSGSVVTDKKAIAEALALLGQSRMANNLNQLAHQANIGGLVIEDRERAKIDEAYGYILSLRALLVTALGQER